MQALTGARTSLACSDCKTNFSSAALLLKHFAEHISSNHVPVREGSTESESEDNRNESILERVLRSPASSSSGATEAASPASVSDESQKITTDEQQIPDVSITKVESNKEFPLLYELAKGNNNNNNNNNHNNKNISYVKLDLQKRLENCVNNFPSGSDSNDGESIQKDKVTTVTASTEQDEFNPLKFCVVTLEEGNEKIELNDITPSKACVNPVSDPQQQYKKYVCTYCSKRFGWSTDLKRHILTHTGERPFQCQLCGATFTRNFLLQKHVLKLHKFVDQQKQSSEAKIDITTVTELTSDPNTLNDSEISLSKRRRQEILVDGRKF